jgi:predicted TPR repeat methyltransferase
MAEPSPPADPTTDPGAHREGDGSVHRHGEHEIAVNDFDAKAATWDDDPAKVERAQAVAGAIAARIQLSPSTRLLEYGAGTGLVTEALRSRVGPATLADTSAGMREVIQAKIDAGTLADATVWSLDLSAEPPPPDRFDLIVTVLTLHHIADLDPVLRRFAELLDPDGTVCVVDLEEEDGSFHGDEFAGHRGFRRTDLEAQLRRAGFDDLTYEICHQMERHGNHYPVFLATAVRRGAST